MIAQEIPLLTAVLQRKAPEDMETLRSDLYIQDLTDELLWQLADSSVPVDPKVITKVAALQMAVHDRAFEKWGERHANPN